MHGLGGEIGHNPLPGFDLDFDGPKVDCYCGSVNCVESFVSGTGLERAWALNHPTLSAKAIFDAYKQGDADAVKHVDYYCDCVARVLASIINVIDPEIIVLVVIESVLVMVMKILVVVFVVLVLAVMKVGLCG